MTPIRRVRGREVTTVEGLAPDVRAAWGEAFAATGGSQCGFCTPGIVMVLYALFREHPRLSTAELEEHFDGNLCRCTGYDKIIRAVLDTAAEIRGA